MACAGHAQCASDPALPDSGPPVVVHPLGHRRSPGGASSRKIDSISLESGRQVHRASFGDLDVGFALVALGQETCRRLEKQHPAATAPTMLGGQS